MIPGQSASQALWPYWKSVLRQSIRFLSFLVIPVVLWLLHPGSEQGIRGMASGKESADGWATRFNFQDHSEPVRGGERNKSRARGRGCDIKKALWAPGLHRRVERMGDVGIQEQAETACLSCPRGAWWHGTGKQGSLPFPMPSEVSQVAMAGGSEALGSQCGRDCSPTDGRFPFAPEKSTYAAREGPSLQARRLRHNLDGWCPKTREESGGSCRQWPERWLWGGRHETQTPWINWDDLNGLKTGFL